MSISVVCPTPPTSEPASSTEGIQTEFSVPAGEAAGGSGIGPTGVQVADLRGEKFNGAFCRLGVSGEKRRECSQLAGLDAAYSAPLIPCAFHG